MLFRSGYFFWRAGWLAVAQPAYRSAHSAPGWDYFPPGGGIGISPPRAVPALRRHSFLEFPARQGSSLAASQAPGIPKKGCACRVQAQLLRASSWVADSEYLADSDTDFLGFRLWRLGIRDFSFAPHWGELHSLNM